MGEIGKLLIVVGGLIVVVGVAILFAGRISWLGRLPGDIAIETGNVSCFFPLATSIVLSIVLTIVLNLLFRIMNK